ncbi:MAG TPA: branched-chain amino acid ABC transporter permease [Rhodospirillales bacterium]|jgi:branched-chain amino acid transport system permease protein|nr:branched-chain amino acid ABC transporter permease [Rhodospirillales bacterium]|tara:strand:+ start:53 stop:928 length:876 start_codon:yes stop_codon:yes gene_type:complete
MYFFLQLTLSGLTQGAIYGLIALSLTVVYRATTVVNFGHGDFVMAGAFVVYVLVIYLGMSYLPAALLAVVILFCLGVGISRGFIDPIKSGPHIGFAMMSISLGYILRGGARTLWGREVFPMPRVFDTEPIFLGELVVTGDVLFICAIVGVLLTAFFVIFYRTTVGTLIQAVYQSERGATLIGVNVQAFHQSMWGVGLAMGAIGGILIAPISLLHPDLGATFLIRGFAAMTLGGFGSLGGAVVGGLLLGVAEQNLGFYVNSALIDITAYLVIVAVLVIRPAGLFGKTVTVRM